jgi:hypothetical protein
MLFRLASQDKVWDQRLEAGEEYAAVVAARLLDL